MEPFEQTLEVPEEGVKDEWEQDLEYFDSVYVRRQEREASVDELGDALSRANASGGNPASPWTRFKNGGRAFYARRDTGEETLDEPAEGVKDEVALDDDEFERSSTRRCWRRRCIRLLTGFGTVAGSACRCRSLCSRGRCCSCSRSSLRRRPRMNSCWRISQPSSRACQRPTSRTSGR